MTKKVFAIFIIAITCFSATAQEILTMPSYNPLVARQYQTQQVAKSVAASAITLPFYDDFSVISVFPLLEAVG